MKSIGTNTNDSEQTFEITAKGANISIEGVEDEEQSGNKWLSQ